MVNDSRWREDIWAGQGRVSKSKPEPLNGTPGAHDETQGFADTGVLVTSHG